MCIRDRIIVGDVVIVEDVVVGVVVIDVVVVAIINVLPCDDQNNTDDEEINVDDALRGNLAFAKHVLGVCKKYRIPHFRKCLQIKTLNGVLNSTHPL